MNRQYNSTEEGAVKLLSEIFGEDDAEMPAEYKERLVENILYRARMDDDSPEDDLWEELSPADNKQEKPGTSRNRIPQLKIILSVAAVFIFLLGGTLLTREKHRSGEPSENHPTTVVHYSDNSQSTDKGFVQDLWQFVKTAAPYLGCAAVGAGLTLLIVRKRR